MLAWAPWPANAWPTLQDSTTDTTNANGGHITLQELQKTENEAFAEMSPQQRQQAGQLANQFTAALTQQNAQNLASVQQQSSEMLQQFQQMEQQNAPQPAPSSSSSEGTTSSSQNNQESNLSYETTTTSAPAPLSATQLLQVLPQGAASSLQSALQASSEAVQAETNAAANAASQVEQQLEFDMSQPSPPPPSVVSLLQTLPQQNAAQLGQLIQQQQQQTISLLEQDLQANQNAPAPSPSSESTTSSSQEQLASSTDGLSSSEALWISSEVGAPANAVLSELTQPQLQALQQLAGQQA